MDEISSQKTVSDQWLQNIIESLQRLQLAEYRAKEGCYDLLEFIQNPLSESDLAIIMHKNYKLFMTDYSILLSNIKRIAEDELYKACAESFNSLNDLEQKQNGFIRKLTINGETQFKLSDNFTLVVTIISKLRSLAVESLWRILSPSASENVRAIK